MLNFGAHMVSPIRQGWNLERLRSARASPTKYANMFVRRRGTRSSDAHPGGIWVAWVQSVGP